MDKQTYIPNPEDTRDTPRGVSGRIDRNVPSSPVITSESLAPSKPLEIPEAKKLTDSLRNLSMSLATKFPTEEEMTRDSEKEMALTKESNAKSERQGLLDRAKDLIGMQSERGNDTQNAQDDVQLAQKREALNESNKAALRLEREYMKEVERIEKNPEGLFGGALQDRLNDAERNYLSKKADLAIDRLANQGDVDTALAIVEDTINAKYEPIEQEINAIKEFMALNENDLTESEQLQLQSTIREKEAEAQLGRDKDLADYKARIEKNSDVPLPAGELELARANEGVELISNLLSDGNIRSAVGPTAFGRFFGKGYDKASGGRQNFIASVEQLRQQLTLDSLIQAKAEGATFGALSDSELRTLSASASKLGTWAKLDEDGNVVAYNASERDFKKELDRINNFAKLDYILKGGNASDVGVIEMPDGSLVTENSDGTIAQLR